MPKDRLTDTFTYLKAQAAAVNLPGVKVSDIADFERLVRSLDQTNGGNVLSLGWSQLDKNRPSQNTRHAIRAYLLVSIYNNNLAATGAHTEAVRVKTFGAHYDIVIDPTGSDEFDNAYQLEALGGKEKKAILERQRRLSYGNEATVKTMAQSDPGKLFGPTREGLHPVIR